VVAVLHDEADPDPGQRHERKGELPQPHFSTDWHYQAGFGPDSPCL
jgi:hypothetical protein